MDDFWNRRLRNGNSHRKRRENYRYCTNQREIQFLDMRTDPVIVVPIDILVSFRGIESDITSGLGQLASRAHGPWKNLGWQIFSWQHEPASEIVEFQAANEISLGQIVKEKIGPSLQGKTDSQHKFRWKDGIPQRTSRNSTISRL
jgi:hypothetical protein